MTLVAARAYKLDILDGVHNDFGDEARLRDECEKGRIVEGNMVERLHFAMAQRTVDIADRIREMEAACG